MRGRQAITLPAFVPHDGVQVSVSGCGAWAYAFAVNGVAQNKIVCWPWWPEGGAINQFGVRVNAAAAAGGVARIGIYANATTDLARLYPGTLLFGSASFPVDALGATVFPVDIAVTPNTLYWTALLCGVAGTPSFLGNANKWPLLGVDLVNGVIQTGWEAAFPFAALPDPFPGGAVAGSQAEITFGHRYVVR